MLTGLLPAAASQRKTVSARAAWPEPESLPLKWLSSAAAWLQYRAPVLQNADYSRSRQSSFPPRLPVHGLHQRLRRKNREERRHPGRRTVAERDRQKRDGGSR